jgi:mevalonate pyrophosphate decarboxylase
LFANTYHIEEGIKAILAPVRLDSSFFPVTVDLNRKLNGNALPLSTGAFLSARFPFISPAAKLDATHHFLDGGLKENSGAETAAELYEIFQSRLGMKIQKDSTYRSMEVYFISLNSAGNNEPEMVSRNMMELTAPASALYNNWVGNTLKADSVLSMKAKNRYFLFRPYQDTVRVEGENVRPILPLGWQISDLALRRLSGSIFPGPQSENCTNVHAVVNIVNQW